MKKTVASVWRYGFITAVFLLLTSLTQGQGITSASFSGRIVSPEGDAIAGAVVTAIHTPSGTRFTTTTAENGRYLLSNLRVGGPYTIIASKDGYQPVAQDQTFAALSKTLSVNLAFGESTEQVFELDAFTVTSSGNSIISSGTIGVSTNIDELLVDTAPLVRRNINDIARFNPLTAITEDDRNELSVAGQNSRFNSIMIDGVRVNDQFGLESSGQTSLNSPVSLDTVEEVAVEVAPYDVRQTGFTGAAINVVTKSGTNEFTGSLFYNYYDESLRGDEPNGDNDPIEEVTWGATLGGPIIKDTLFFFVAYEEFSREEAGGTAFFTPDADALAAIDAYEASLGVDFGEFGGSGTRKTTEEKISVKIDWNITDDHRLAVKYFTNEGVLPNVGNFDDFGETALDTNFYTQLKDEEQWSAQLYSTWTDNFTTELSFGYGKYRQPTTFPEPLPQIFIDDFPAEDGVAGSYAPSSTSGALELFLGTEQFRHANNLEWDTYNYSASADWILDGHSISFGIDREESEFANLFLQGSFGVFSYDTFEDFLADTLSSRFDSYRSTGVTGTDPVARPDYAITGLFAQDVIQVTDKLNILIGARLDFVTSDNTPPEAFTATGETFESVFGFKNNGTIDGEIVFAPRFGFNYQVDEDAGLQLRGGVGLFAGRSPAVWIANSFTNNGATTNEIQFEDPDAFSLADYLNNDFDPNNPILYIGRADGRPEVNVTEEGLQMPSSWRANIALDKQLWDSNWVFTMEFLTTVVNQALWVEDVNLRPAGTAPDGRALFSGRNNNDFSNVYVLRNTSQGLASNLVLQIRKEFSDNWYLDASYTMGNSTDVNPFTSSRASSNYVNRVVFNQNVDENGTSNFEVKHRILVRAGYDFRWLDNFVTRVGVVYEGRSGRPYSATFGNDFNGDGVFGNDAFYVPTGPNDPLVTFSDTTDIDAFFAYLGDRGYDKYAGGAVPRNAKQNTFVHRWDINITQEIPLYENVGLDLFVNILNVGNMLNDEWGLVEEYGFPFRERIADGSITSDGRIEIDFDDGEDAAVRVGSRRSRWAVMMGARLNF